MIPYQHRASVIRSLGRSSGQLIQRNTKPGREAFGMNWLVKISACLMTSATQKILFLSTEPLMIRPIHSAGTRIHSAWIPLIMPRRRSPGMPMPPPTMQCMAEAKEQYCIEITGRSNIYNQISISKQKSPRLKPWRTSTSYQSEASHQWDEGNQHSHYFENHPYLLRGIDNFCSYNYWANHAISSASIQTALIERIFSFELFEQKRWDFTHQTHRNKIDRLAIF